MVPTIHRGKGYASALAKSFLHYAPALGYKASVFNLVYTNNLASVRYVSAFRFSRCQVLSAGLGGSGPSLVFGWKGRRPRAHIC